MTDEPAAGSEELGASRHRMRSAISAGLSDPDRKTLLQQIAWFNRLRLIAVVGVAVTAWLAGSVFGLLETAWPVYALCCLFGAVDLGYFAAYARLQSATMRGLRRHVDLQIAIDLVVLTALLSQSGGIGNPFVLFYLFHPTIASLLLSVRAAVVVASFSLACVAGLGYGQLAGLLPPGPSRLAMIDVARSGALGCTAFLLAFALTLASSIYFVATVLSRLRRREDELDKMRTQLAHSEKLASVGTLAAGVSHEINNPVAVIRTKAQILRYRIADGDPQQELLKEVETIERHTQRIEQITKGLLTFSREAPFQLSVVELNPLVQEGAELVRVPFQDKKIPLRLELDPTGPRIHGSANHLRQVIVNILLNARDASPAGAEVRVATRVVQQRVCLSFTDRGQGIRPEHLPRIFDPFFTTKDVDTGTGLGLAITHGIVERHAGTIEVQSEPGAGTGFHVWLPRLP